MNDLKPALIRVAEARRLLGMTATEFGCAVRNKLIRSARISQRLTLVHVEDLERILERELRPNELLEHEKKEAQR